MSKAWANVRDAARSILQQYPALKNVCHAPVRLAVSDAKAFSKGQVSAEKWSLQPQWLRAAYDADVREKRAKRAAFEAKQKRKADVHSRFLSWREQQVRERYGGTYAELKELQLKQREQRRSDGSSSA